MICSNKRQFGAIICQLHLCDACFVEAKDLMQGSMTFPFFFCAQLKQELSTAGTVSHIAAHICHLRGAAVTSAFLQAPMEGAHNASATESK